MAAADAGPDGAPAGGWPPFRPRRFWAGPHAQTLRNAILGARPPPGPVERLEFPMPDGTGDRLTGALSRPPGGGAGRPLVLLLHGLAGCEDSAYMLASARHFLAAGHAVLRLNLRGSPPTRPGCREFYHAGRDADPAAVLELLAARGTAPDGVVAMGFSLGGAVLAKLLGAGRAAAPPLAAMAVSAPIDLAATCARFERPGNRPYHAWLLRHAKRDAAALRGIGARELRAIRSARTIREFDDRFTAPRNGFDGADDYYARCSASRFLAGIRAPFLLVQAMDDPWIPARSYREADWRAAPAITPLLPERGGHVGFHEAGGRWHDRMASLFLERLGLSGGAGRRG